jgi:hypothetical protein
MMSTAVATRRAYVWPSTNEEYHRDHARISHSALDTFRECRKRYYATFVAKTLAKPEPTPAMRLGSLLHLRVLEPERYNETIAIAPACDRRTTIGKNIWAGFCEANAGRQVIKRQENDEVQAMAFAVESGPKSSLLLTLPGPREHTSAWTDAETGLECKCRFDLCGRVLVDLKTCADASPAGFARAAANFGYHRQAAWYLDGHLAFAGTPTRFGFVAVCTEPPHEVAVYELDADAIRMGRHENREALNDLAECMETGDWLAEHERTVSLLKLPRWYCSNQYEV